VTNQGGLVFPDDSQVLAYDLDGNLTFDGTWTYEWDGENRLKTMVMTNVVNIPPTNRFRLDFAYDFQGRRVQKIVSTNSTGNAFVPQSTNRFVYDSWNLVAALNPSFALQQSFLWGQDLSGTMDGAGGVGGLVALCEYSGGQLADAYFCAFDGNGNVAALTKASSFQTTARYEYSPFGETMRATGPLAKANPFRFSTKFWDEETGLVYYGQRYYSSSKGGWLGRDPAEAKVRGSTYSFVQNRPIDLIDPDGMVPLNPAVAAQILTALLLWNATAFASGNFIAGELDDEMLEWTEKTMMGNSGAPKPPIKRGPKTPRPPKSAPNPTANRVRRWIQRGPHYGGMFSIVGGILAINGTAATVSQFGALTQTVADFAGHAVAGETAWADLDAATFAAQLQGNGSDYLFTMSMLNNLLQLEETR
jgi:RHS repeat-associated protein